MKLRLTSMRKMGKAAWEDQGKPYWRAQSNRGFIELPRTRGCRFLDVTIDAEATPGERIRIWAGGGRRGVEEFVLVASEESGPECDHELGAYTRKYDDAMVPKVVIGPDEVVRVKDCGGFFVDGREWDSFQRRLRESGMVLVFNAVHGDWSYYLTAKRGGGDL